MSLQEAKQFVAHFVSGDYTPEEYATFLQWLRGATFDELNVIADEHESLHEGWPLPASGPSPEWVAMLEGKLDELSREEYEMPVMPVGTRRMIHRRVWVAAASAVVVLAAGALLYTQRAHVDSRLTTRDHGTAAPVLAQVMENPAGGGQKELVLADGSKIWLNSASTLKYPAVFTGAERVVELSGEAFFEVTKSAGKPFRVLVKDAEVEVLGTHFNIMAYDNEPVSKTTLIDGAVRIECQGKQKELTPGDQALLRYAATGSGEPEIEVTRVDADASLAWRKGNIDFRNADVHTVMRALKRYYNVDIQYAQAVPDTKLFTAGLLLQDGLQHNLGIVGGFFDLHFKIDGKVVTVTR